MALCSHQPNSRRRYRVNTKVDKKTLLGILHKNRATHREIFEEAVEGYRKMAVNTLEEHITRIKSKKGVSQVYVHLTQPMDRTRDYDHIIGLLEMSVDE